MTSVPSAAELIHLGMDTSVQESADGELGAVFLEIDPTSDPSVAAAADRVRSE